MSRTWLLFFLFCLVLVFALAPLSGATLTLRVDESTTRIIFSDADTNVTLPITNSLGRQVAATIKVELLDPDGDLCAKTNREVLIKPGANTVSVPIQPACQNRASDLLWYRLQYQVAPSNPTEFDSVHGVIAVSEIAPDIFALQVASSAKAQEGSGYRLRIRAANPLTTRGVAGIKIEAQLKFEGYQRDDIVLQQEARTGPDGFATLDFQLPRTIEDNDGEITVKASRGMLKQSAESEISVDHDAQVMVSTDKPLYQPGQVLHTRVLMFNSARRALGEQQATLKISDPENSSVFRTDLTTSRFGVASADWTIPENTRLGDYRVEVEIEGDKYDDSYGATTVKISRYDLPNFTVAVKPDRPYYLPGQNADVEVRGDYLFGQPVKHGHVRVVRETERHWNYREQKYETEEGDKYEGEVDADGRFIAHVNLSKEHETLKDEDYSRYSDLTYAAYFTDTTTNRTEQRRFDLRLTKNAIHLYVINDNNRQARDFPLEFYVSSVYADGTPAQCEVALSRVWDKDESRGEQALRTIKTNRYGLAKVTGLVLPQTDADDNEVSLLLRAHGENGATGEHTESIYTDQKLALRVEADKALYRDGEPLNISLASNQLELPVNLDLINDQKVVQSQLVQLRNGRAALSIPYRREFNGPVTIAAYSPTAGSEDDAGAATRTVLYPHDRDLKFTLALNHDTYKPGEEASATFLTRTAAGRAAESALGVVIFDKAVEERARTDREFGGKYGFNYVYCYLNDCGGSIAGISRKDLDQIDLSKSLPQGLDLVAEVLLTNYRFEPRIFQSERYEKDPAKVFARFVESQINPLKDRLDVEYKDNCDYPSSLDALQRFATLAGINLDELRDPWETRYRIAFFPRGDEEVLQIDSAGADKRFDNGDDFVLLRIERPYFRFTGEAINRAVANFHTRTGRFIRDENTLKNELRRQGIDFDNLRDPWGQPYQLDFDINRTNYVTHVRSAGPDHKFTPLSKNNDDVLLWTSSIDYARETEAKIDLALAGYLKTAPHLPQNEAEFAAALSQTKISKDELRDPWGRAYYFTFKRDASYGNRVTIYNYARYGEPPKEKTDLTPVTQYIDYIYVRSNGEDGKTGTPDDFNVATLSRLTAQQAVSDPSPKPVQPSVALRGSTGAITGTVTDLNGAVIAGARVSARSTRAGTTFEAATGVDGAYVLKNLPSGFYEVTVDASGFQRSVISNVFVRSSSLTQVNVTLNIGAVNATVMVTATGPSLVQTTSSELSVTRNFRADFGKSFGAVGQQLSTPRLREYFPETLVWQPSLETDKQGRALLKFKLADNITTWKMSVIGSTEDGQIGTVEREIKSFQPFFVEHDPPRILTEGDEISLPVVVRNYLDRAQPISLEIKPEGWFSLLGPATQRSEVAAGDATRVSFAFRASASVKDGKQRITATGADANDAIEKPVTVHPDGQQQSVAASDVVSGNGSVMMAISPNAIPNSVQAELKIYPNLLAHVAESVEAIMERPYGCGEQTISSTYPSLLLLRNFKKTGEDSPLRAKATRYLHDGYSRLLNYRDESGGFSYWGRGEPDIALTAYALRFLSDSRELIAVDDNVVKQAREWLIKQQRPDGSWKAYDYGRQVENQKRTALLTAYVARVLAATAPAVKGDSTAAGKQVSLELKHALDYLAPRIEEIDEPYLIASYALAAIEVGDANRASGAITKLRALAHEENGGAYWSLETNTPFYGWGLAGRIETTALATQALTRAAPRLRSDDQLINRAVLFLLREKDRYGVWYSTQATINVLDTLLALLTPDLEPPRKTSAPSMAVVLINGRQVKSLELPAAGRLSGPITTDLSTFVEKGQNRIEVRQDNSAAASIQAVANYYVPWSDSESGKETNSRTNGASALRLVARFDTTEARVGDSITCHVEAERIGFSGYGMMLAEIGLPPGADVDRASLEQAMKSSDWSISQYDILPDRVVVYLWPRAGGTKFDFKFRPRLGIKAQTAASTVYDYYNPEAHATVSPVRFVVK